MSETRQVDTENNPQVEGKAEQKTNGWGNVLKRTFHNISSKNSWIPNSVVTLIAFFMGPLSGTLFNSKKATLIGAGLGFTIVIWLFIYFVYRNIEETPPGPSTPQPQPQPQVAQPSADRPTFRHRSSSVTLTVGGISGTRRIEDLRTKPDPHMLIFWGYSPFLVYVEGDRLYVDVKLYAGPGIPSIELKHNDLVQKPANWDLNFNNTALEIVNEDKDPVFQLIYRDDSHILINGKFPIPNGVALARDGQFSVTNQLQEIRDFRLKQLFKYPAWRHKGEYADE